MIVVRDNVFGIHGEGFSCLLRVNAYGLLEQLYFGAPVETSDWEVFCCRDSGELVMIPTNERRWTLARNCIL